MLQASITNDFPETCTLVEKEINEKKLMSPKDLETLSALKALKLKRLRAFNASDAPIYSPRNHVPYT
jgi:hypothetical protein